MKEVKRTLEAYLAQLEEELPPIVFRNWRRWRDCLPVSSRTMANLDSLGRGPREKILCGHVVGYPRSSLIEWLRERITVLR